MESRRWRGVALFTSSPATAWKKMHAILDKIDSSHLLQIEVQRLTRSDTKYRQRSGIDGEEEGGDDKQHAEQVQVEAVHDEAGGVGPQEEAGGDVHWVENLGHP